MTDPTKTKQVLSTGRRRLIAAAGLASPLFFMRNGWAAGKSMYVGTYTGVQGEYMRHQVIPKFESDLSCKIFQTENVTLGNIGIMRTQKANPNYSVMMMDDVGVPIAKGEGLIDRLPKDKIPNLAKVFPSFIYNDGYGAAFAISTVSPWYNKNIAKPIESFADLWSERFRGRFMLLTPKQTQSVQLLAVAASMVTGKPILEAQYELDKGWPKMMELKPNVQTIYDNFGTADLQDGGAEIVVDRLHVGFEFHHFRPALVELVLGLEDRLAGDHRRRDRQKLDGLRLLGRYQHEAAAKPLAPQIGEALDRLGKVLV